MGSASSCAKPARWSRGCSGTRAQSSPSSNAELLLHFTTALFAHRDGLASVKRDLVAAQRPNRLLVDQIRAMALQKAILGKQLARLRQAVVELLGAPIGQVDHKLVAEHLEIAYIRRQRRCPQPEPTRTEPLPPAARRSDEASSTAPRPRSARQPETSTACAIGGRPTPLRAKASPRAASATTPKEASQHRAPQR